MIVCTPVICKILKHPEPRSASLKIPEGPYLRSRSHSVGFGISPSSTPHSAMTTRFAGVPLPVPSRPSASTVSYPSTTCPRRCAAGQGPGCNAEQDGRMLCEGCLKLACVLLRRELLLQADFPHLSEDAILLVEVLRRREGDVELRALRPWPGVRHRQEARLRVRDLKVLLRLPRSGRSGHAAGVGTPRATLLKGSLFVYGMFRVCLF